MTEQTESAPKEKRSLGSILKLVAMILAVLVFVITAVTNMAVVYIVFAPDTFPKPFYLVYYLPGEEPTLPAVASAETTDSHSTESTMTHSTMEDGSESPSYSYTWENIQPGQGIILDTGTKIVNLSDPSGKYIRTNVVLEFAPNDPVYFSDEVHSDGEDSGGHGGAEVEAVPAADLYEAEFLTELETRMPVINDSIITLLSTKDFEDVYTAEGKDTLRDEIMAAVNSRLPEYHVIYIYFTEFVVQ